MYRVMLVDDDVAVLEFLKQLVPWEQMGFGLSGVFTRAADALEMCRKEMPDLIITDIGMPGMNGLELIQCLQTEAGKTQFVILSCHDEFHYAQQAVKLGVHDYILKETLDLAGIQGILDRVLGKLEEERRLKQQVDRLYYQAQKNKAALKEKWLRDLLAGPVIEDRPLLGQLQEFGLNTQLGHILPVLCRVFSFQDAIIRYQKEDVVKFIVENAAEELLEGEPDVMFFGRSAQEFVLLYSFRKDFASNPYEKIVQVCRTLQLAFAKYLKLEFSMLIGEPTADGAGIKRQLPVLLSAADHLFYFEGPAIVKSNHSAAVWMNQEDLFEHYSDYAERFNRLLLEGSGDVEHVVDAFVGFMKNRNYHPADVKQMVWKLALDLQLKLKFSMAYDKEKMQQTVQHMMNVSEVREWLVKFIQKAVRQAEHISRESKKAEIVDIQKYVMLHLNRKITLEEAAAHLHLNPSYFSRLFKKETGENFIEFVTRMKMEKAKMLLEEMGRTVEQVALQLGYDNKSYFIKLFKQHYGIPPGKFVKA
ncbi:helix-turn-helix domain-containing protein [Cohnella pontilimi]|uniref:Helix-turn-helix domain-containing protein n=1 Tax=Cohnella pontilimi TaxID=2564100 RepID=A0A4V5LS71_9BACL|nr:helix-turn-helix domain-containing protein [Cohnella pontilimi]TJY41569.1 helix-turn-helix domain-containing protein [Cohnella pontilimi]